MDLDRTLAKYDGWDDGKIGPVILPMLARVKGALSQGVEIKIFTARACDPSSIPLIQDWLEKNGLPRLEVTNAKDFSMLELWDDRAVSVEPNTGRFLTPSILDAPLVNGILHQ